MTQIVGWMEFLDESNAIMFLLCIGGTLGLLILRALSKIWTNIFRRKKDSPDKETVV